MKSIKCFLFWYLLLCEIIKKIRNQQYYKKPILSLQPFDMDSSLFIVIILSINTYFGHWKDQFSTL